MKAGIGFREGLAFATLFFVTQSLSAADAGLVYDKKYQCGTEIILVGHCRRDSDTPDMPPTTDADNYCQVYYFDRPKNGMGGTAFGIELRGDLEKRLTACGALAAVQPAPRPASAQPAAPVMTDAQAQAAQAGKYYDAKDYAKAAESYRKAIALDPKLASAHEALAAALYFQGQYQAAIAEWQRYLVLKPNNATMIAAIGVAYRRLKKYPESIAYLQKAVDLNPESKTMKDALTELAKTYDEAGQSQTAMQAANRLKALDATRGQQLIESLQQSAGRRAANDQLQLGQKLYESKDYVKAIAAFQAAIPLTPDATTAALADRWIANAYRELKSYDKAFAALRESLQLEPVSANTQFALGLTYYETKRYPEALASLQEAIRLDPKDAEIHFWIGQTQLVGLKQPDKALAAYRESLKLRPNDARTSNQTGLAYDQLKQQEAAIAAFKDAIRLKPAEPIYYRNLALQFAEAGDFGDAKRISGFLRKINAQKADELDGELLDLEVTSAVDKPAKP